MNKLIFFLLGIALIIGIAGCEKGTVVSVATADVFIQSIRNPKDPDPMTPEFLVAKIVQARWVVSRKRQHFLVDNSRPP